MELKLYITRSPNNALLKELTDEVVLEGTLRDGDVSITTPMVRVATRPSANYCFIPEFERYYFIEDIRSYRNGMWYLSLRVDVLMSFRREILELNALISKQENAGNPYAEDVELEARNTLEEIPFEREINDPQIILITVRGGE